MTLPERDHAQLALECGASAARFLTGAAAEDDLPGLLRRAGIEAPEQLAEDPAQPLWLRQLAAVAEPLRAATAALCRTDVQGREHPLAQADAQRELDRTVDPQRLTAIAAALQQAHQQALQGPLDRAFAVLDALLPETGQSASEPPFPLPLLGDLVAGAGKGGQHRLVRARLTVAPMPIEAWRGQLRDLTRALLTPTGAAIGVAEQLSAYGPAALCARHPRQRDRISVFTRQTLSLSVARAFAAATGAAIAHAMDRPDQATTMATLLCCRLAAASLWRSAGLSRSDARDAARDAGKSLVALLGRLTAYLCCGDTDARAMAAAAGELLREADDLPAALRWRGPYPDPMGLPITCGPSRLTSILSSCTRGLALDARLTDDLGDDWHRNPDADTAVVDGLDEEPGEIDTQGMLIRLVQP